MASIRDESAALLAGPSGEPHYPGPPAHIWITAMRPRRMRTASNQLMPAISGG